MTAGKMSIRHKSSSVSIVVPAFNAGQRIGRCLKELCAQAQPWNAEILVVNDGSSDNTAGIARCYPQVRVINQTNSGPARARNRGAFAAKGALLVFTDDDCVPASGWLDAMLKPFDDPEVVATKGVYRTKQKELIARFVQAEYEDRYRLMKRLDSIDFVDTYSAAFRRDRFLQMNGFNPEFPLASAEDAELSYRMSARGWKMKFVPEAVVYHSHPATLWQYCRKKYKFACWRVVALRRNPQKALKDSHTPQLMKLQLLFIPMLLLAGGIDLVQRWPLTASAIVLAMFLLSTLPFVVRAMKKDLIVALVSPALLAIRSGAQLLGVIAGLNYSHSKPVQIATKSAA
jgi:cellulose synthase/poly-beta-1,6-N-acetylglucosamine synthase-like glycosyltransferase